MISLKTKIVAFSKSLLHSLLVVLIDIILIFFFSGVGSRFNYNLSFVLLLEGGIGLIIGGAVVLYSPSLSKMSEVFFNHKPWSFKHQKQVENQAKPLIITGLIIIIEAFLISAI